MTYAIGSLVRARGREWVVLPESDGDLLVLRPLGGTEEETTGIYTPLEPVLPATFGLPDPSAFGDDRSCRLLRDAVRLGFRSSAGPFRSFGRLSVEPRPYQLVPLLVALRRDPVRILIADDVGVGKTVEASLIARELLDRGDAKRLCVLCPPHLAEQWQDELRDKFHIEAELLLPGTARRLERGAGLQVGETIWERYDAVVASVDYLKSDRHRDDFLRHAPDLVIVDEAHTCALAEDVGKAAKSRKQRHELVRRLAEDPGRHFILVTATPHSGKDEEFRSLLALLDPDLGGLPDDLSGDRNKPHRERLAQFLVQRRRADIRHFMQRDTPFPEREEREETYKLHPEYASLFERAIDLARESVESAAGDRRRQRVRWWSMLALLRSLASSPAAAAATLNARSQTLEAETPEEVDAIGEDSTFDRAPEDEGAAVDAVPGSDVEETPEDTSFRRRLRELSKVAEGLRGKKDYKLGAVAGHVAALLNDGFQPIVFCRFIPTAEYVAAALRDALPKHVKVEAVTGTLAPAEREERVATLGKATRRVLVATDCLSEGINLQHGFDAVIHYDLSWNPTRHEQREGRVDRYGQKRSAVRVLTLYGVDNGIDGAVLEVLLRKHQKIRKATGVSVAVPADLNSVSDAIYSRLILSPKENRRQTLLFPEVEREKIHRDWDLAVQKRSRTMFAQETVKPEEVARELAASRAAIGAGVDVRDFVFQALRAHGAQVEDRDPLPVTASPQMPRALREALSLEKTDARFEASFELPVPDGVLHLERTHPMVEALATYVMDAALDDGGDAVARRCGAIRTTAVATRTTALLVRFRFHIVVQHREDERTLLAEEVRLLAFTGSPDAATWLPSEEADRLVEARPDANIVPQQAETFARRVVEGFDALRPHLDRTAQELAEQLLDAHRRVREAAKRTHVKHRVEPKLPPDVLGLYVYLPAAGV